MHRSRSFHRVWPYSVLTFVMGTNWLLLTHRGFHLVYSLQVSSEGWLLKTPTRTRPKWGVSARASERHAPCLWSAGGTLCKRERERESARTCQAARHLSARAKWARGQATVRSALCRYTRSPGPTEGTGVRISYVTFPG